MKKYLLIIILNLLILASCKKQNEWLDVKSNKADVVPVSLKDFQALMDNTNIMNSSLPIFGLIGTDNLNLNDVAATTVGNLSERNAYKWAPDIYEGLIGFGTNDWVYPYRMVEYSNIALEGIEKIPVTQSASEWNNVKGSALFFRALANFSLAQLYAKPYDKATAANDPGIPIKLSADINEKAGRGTVQATYNQIISDLNSALALLPNQPLYKSRPSRAAVFALLAKVYLNMQEYGLALQNATETNKLFNFITDFNTVNGTPVYPFPTYQGNNPEILFYGAAISYSTTDLTNLLVPNELYDLYAANDLRKTLFYRVNTDGSKNFRGRYTGGVTHFSGFATNEILLIMSECQARLGNVPVSMDILNNLLIKRWKTGTYIPYIASNETQALSIILTERRKELPYTGNLRWEDLRRLNKDSRFAKTLTRVISGETFTLPPNDQRYTLPIIPAEITLSGLPQNPR